ncbi:MAG: phosphate/phosphite/phosphonate ABC transporter substrate-binding protein [SAR324 cluster bacterium]|nr:phosphate/phosphite/phosphonate ABC transporter substrate-binding protein [SAR324 cluster bacterium]
MKKTVILCVSLFFFSILATASETDLRFGIASIISPERNFSLYQKFSWYLSRKLDKRVELIIQKDYAAMNKMVTDGTVDFANICSGAFQFLPKDKVPILVIPVIRGKRTYNSYIITHKNSGARTFHELKGKTFLFTDPLSITGTMYPGYILRQTGETAASFFSKSYFSANHDRSVYLINQGVVDGAAVSSQVYDFMKEDEPESVQNVVIIDVSMDFTGPPMVGSPSLNGKMFNRIRQVLLQMHKNTEGQRILKNMKIDRFDSPPEKAYGNVRKIYLDQVFGSEKKGFIK